MENKKQNRVIKFNGEIYKTCKNCWVTKNVTEFKSNWYSRIGTKLYKPDCKYCLWIKLRNYRILNNKEVNEKRKVWADKNRELIREHGRNRYARKTEEEKKKILLRNRINYRKRLWN